MDLNLVIEALKKEAQHNKVSNEVLHMLAIRERARYRLTIGAIAQRMKKEGYNYPKYEYVPLIKLLGVLGLGKLELNGKGNIIGLKEIRFSLKSIGEAAIGKLNYLKAFINEISL